MTTTTNTHLRDRLIVLLERAEQRGDKIAAIRLRQRIAALG